MVIGTAGCSNSSYGWGNPWHFYMGKEYNCNIVSSSSSGAGNEMNFEKIRYILENNRLDLFVCQLTEPIRIVIGIEEGRIVNPDLISDNLHSNHCFQKKYYYTINAHRNNGNLKRLFNKDYDIDRFIIDNSITSDYNTKIKIFHTMMSMKYLCDFYNVKLIFFSWFIDLVKLSKEIGFDKIISGMNLIPGCVTDYVSENGIPSIPGDSHFDSESHEKIFKGYLNPYILPHIKQLIKII
jgi:hypothetical protein